MVFGFDESIKTMAKLKVIGVGGAGGNAVNRMVISGLQGVEFISVNTDALALEHNKADVKIAIGQKLTNGLGAGANPHVGMMSLEEDRERVKKQLEGADMLFIAAGMGGGTGTGAAPVVAEIAREMGILTVAVVTRPFVWEGPVREKNAVAGLDALRKSVDTMIVVPNQKLLSVVNKGTSLREAFKMADEVLSSATRGISEIILKHGDIQVDFADVRSIMSQGGDALMGTGTASGENRATVAADRAIHSPLLDNISISGATGVLVNITGGEDLGLADVDDAMNFIYGAVGTDNNTNIIFGTVINPDMKEEISITVIATGFGGAYSHKQSPSKPAYAQEIPKKPMHSLYVEPKYVEPKYMEPRTMENFKESPRENIRENSKEIPFPDRTSKSLDEVILPVSKSPFATKSIPTPTRNETPSAVENDPITRKNISLYGNKGQHKEYDPDVDYETPAFLRNQMD